MKLNFFIAAAATSTVIFSYAPGSDVIDHLQQEQIEERVAELCAPYPVKQIIAMCNKAENGCAIAYQCDRSK